WRLLLRTHSGSMQVGHIRARILKKLGRRWNLLTVQQQLKDFPGTPCRLLVCLTMGLAVRTPFRETHNVALVRFAPLDYHSVLGLASTIWHAHASSASRMAL